MMARFNYNTSTPMGQLISSGIDRITNGHIELDRAARSISEMTAEEGEADVGIPMDDFTNFRNRLNDLIAHLADTDFQSKRVMFDQG